MPEPEPLAVHNGAHGDPLSVEHDDDAKRSSGSRIGIPYIL